MERPSTESRNLSWRSAAALLALGAPLLWLGGCEVADENTDVSPTAGPISDLPVEGGGVGDMVGNPQMPDPTDGSGDETTDDPGLPPSAGVDGGTEPPPPECPLQGEWLLVGYACGDLDITDDWMASIDTSVLTIEAGLIEGMCTVHVDHESDTCGELEVLEVMVDGSAWSGQSLGIQSCQPDGCTFNEDDAACEPGDRSGPVQVGYTLVDDTLTLTRSGGGDICASTGMDAIITYERQ